VRSRRLHLKLGDLFRLPLGPDLAGVGQIVAIRSAGYYYFAVFDATRPPDEEPSAVDPRATSIDLLALSMDALLHHGYWQVIGNAPVDATIGFPAYKQATAPGVFDVVDHLDGSRRRATPEEAERLPFRKVVAPIRVQHAFEALHGVRPWSPEYDELRYGDARPASA
jgi:hypothetical protein